jgi:hypothetical protein
MQNRYGNPRTKYHLPLGRKWKTGSEYVERSDRGKLIAVVIPSDFGTKEIPGWEA